MISKQKSSDLKYLAGFGNEISSEHPDFPGALHDIQNNPQKCQHDLIAEQLSGTAFTAPRAENQRSWLYRKNPATRHYPFKLVDGSNFDRDLGPKAVLNSDPNQLRWKPFELPPADNKVDFIDGLHCVATAGQPTCRLGVNIFVYALNQPMEKKAFYNSDGDFLIVPQEGEIHVVTEFGKLYVSPGEICVVQQGIRHQLNPSEVGGAVRGYVCEVFGGHFRLPELGPIGANGLANPRHFLMPVAWLEEDNNVATYEIYNKYHNRLFVCTQRHSPFDVAAWHGNYVPYKYDLSLFNTINTVSYDHMDPSIFTVLTCPGPRPGTALVDLAIFPPRWSVAENTFRPPYFHRNCMSEFMGLIFGRYEAKEAGFEPGGATLHSTMSAHGPDVACQRAAEQARLEPTKVAEGTLAFMFETCLGLQITDWALNQCGRLDADYYRCWHAD